MVQSQEVPRRNRLVGIDSIRFICALTVMCGHLGLVNIRPLAADYREFQSLAIGLYNNLFYGPAAVIVFFIISGFCINYPFSSGKRALNLGGFYTRRFLRIGPPAVVFF
jgi:peptidoglycan/LPS O-acetylase OafA/YrhL